MARVVRSVDRHEARAEIVREQKPPLIAHRRGDRRDFTVDDVPNDFGDREAFVDSVKQPEAERVEVERFQLSFDDLGGLLVRRTVARGLNRPFARDHRHLAFLQDRMRAGRARSLRRA